MAGLKGLKGQTLLINAFLLHTDLLHFVQSSFHRNSPYIAFTETHVWCERFLCVIAKGRGKYYEHFQDQLFYLKC